MSSYEEAVIEMGNFVGTERWHDYMGGAYLPSCREFDGIVFAIYKLYHKPKGIVISDINNVAKNKEKELSEQFKNK